MEENKIVSGFPETSPSSKHFSQKDIPGSRIFVEVKVNFHFLDLFLLHLCE